MPPLRRAGASPVCSRSIRHTIEDSRHVVHSDQQFRSVRPPVADHDAEVASDHAEPDFERPEDRDRGGQRRLLVDRHPDALRRRRAGRDRRRAQRQRLDDRHLHLGRESDDRVNKIKNSLIAAQQPGSDAAKIQTDIAAQQNELKSMVASANFNGDNWLQGDSTAASTTPGSLSNSGVRKLVASYNNATGVSTITVTMSGTTLIDSNTTTTSATNKGILSADGAASGKSVLTMDVTSVPTGKTIADFLKDVDAAIKSLTTVSATLCGAKAAVTTQQSFIEKLQDSLTNGVSSLVDA